MVIITKGYPKDPLLGLYIFMVIITKGYPKDPLLGLIYL